MLTRFIGRTTTALVLAAVAIGAGTAIAAAQSSTDWGWPQPYEKVSDKSVAWLKEKGWWPLGSEHDQRGDGQGGAAGEAWS
jgi:sulfonate transport system substrate-binding protein